MFRLKFLLPALGLLGSLLAAELQPAAAQVFFDGSRIEFQSAVLRSGDALYVPLRELAKGMGLEIQYNPRQDAYTVIRAADARVVEFRLNSRKVRVNDVSEELNEPVLLFKNSFYAPLNDFLWPFGYFVERDSAANYYIVSRLDKIEWQKQTLTLQGGAPLNVILSRTETGYRLLLRNSILGGHAQSLNPGDGVIDSIECQQQALHPGLVQVLIHTSARPPYTIAKNDAENSYALRFNYQPRPPVPAVASVPPARPAAVPPPAARVPAVSPAPDLPVVAVRSVSAAAVVSAAPARPPAPRKLDFPGSNALWLPEKYLSTRQNIEIIIRGRTLNVELRSQNDILYVDFDSVFGRLDCTLQKNQNGGWVLTDNEGREFNFQADGLIAGRDFQEKYTPLNGLFPLVQTLKILGYAAYYTQGRIHINPRIYELSYAESGGRGRVLIRANDKLPLPGLQYLADPPRALLDIPYSAYDVSVNILRPQDQNVKTVRAAQFDKGVVRVVADLTDSQNKPALVLEDEGRALALLFDAPSGTTAGQNIPPATVPSSAAAAAPPAVSSASGPSVSPAGASNQPSLRGLRVAVIVGHGGSDPGAISRQGYLEKDLTLELAKKLQTVLREKGAVALLSREGDENISLDAQAEFARRSKADILVSIHLNYFINESASGAETYYYKPIDQALAKSVHEELLKQTQLKDRGLRKAQMHNLNHTTMPGVLIEPLFLSNRKEEKLIKTQDFQWKLVRAVAAGIENYQKRQK
ncbi:MAG: N-acetylmuramoyl-L-alanine amidase family protein [Candidatus Margulisbacteria bacterium]|jgi:N-acetylmuramoyl-L-alanine amidase|nr:N-acetylmuramoyl-L-alanine amidase family protein [Candidatus Margulisiibacteriota bacterium]